MERSNRAGSLTSTAWQAPITEVTVWTYRRITAIVLPESAGEKKEKKKKRRRGKSGINGSLSSPSCDSAVCAAVRHYRDLYLPFFRQTLPLMNICTSARLLRAWKCTSSRVNSAPADRRRQSQPWSLIRAEQQNVVVM